MTESTLRRALVVGGPNHGLRVPLQPLPRGWRLHGGQHLLHTEEYRWEPQPGLLRYCGAAGLPPRRPG